MDGAEWVAGGGAALRGRGREAKGGGVMGWWWGWGAGVGRVARRRVLSIGSITGAEGGVGRKERGRLGEGRFVPLGPFLAGAGLNLRKSVGLLLGRVCLHPDLALRNKPMFHADLPVLVIHTTTASAILRMLFQATPAHLW